MARVSTRPVMSDKEKSEYAMVHYIDQKASELKHARKFFLKHSETRHAIMTFNFMVLTENVYATFLEAVNKMAKEAPASMTTSNLKALFVQIADTQYDKLFPQEQAVELNKEDVEKIIEDSSSKE